MCLSRMNCAGDHDQFPVLVSVVEVTEHTQKFTCFGLLVWLYFLSHSEGYWIDSTCDVEVSGNPTARSFCPSGELKALSR